MPGYLNRILLTCSLFTCWVHAVAYGQTIEGLTFDVNGGKPLDEVIIRNVHTATNIATDRQGKFEIEAQAGQLIEFKKEGYKIVRFRVPQGKMPPFAKVGMMRYDPSVPHFEDEASPDYKTDSIKYARIYKNELDFPELSGLDVIRHPFSAMSKHNRQIWAFQKGYAANQQEKYIDYIFNDKLINILTGLSGDSLQVYKRMFRPTYGQLRESNDYVYFNYIKRTVTLFRQRGVRAKSSPSRLSH